VGLELVTAQPIVIDCLHGQLALAHNGNLVNAGELRDQLVGQGSIFQTSTDTEVVVHLFARSPEPTVEGAIIEAVSQVSGAFSFVMMTKDKVFGVRDPHGFRPLALGKLGNAWVLASETCAMDLIGATYVRDVEPGEILVISKQGVKSVKPFPPQPLAHCVFEHVYFARPDSYVFGRSVNEVRTEFGRQLAREAPVDADVVVPIPDSGVCASVAGVLLAGYSTQAYHGMGNAFLLPSIAAVVLGGTHILGGRGRYAGTLVGVILIVLLNSVLSIMLLPEAVRQIIYGTVIIGMLLVYGRSERVPS